MATAFTLSRASRPDFHQFSESDSTISRLEREKSALDDYCRVSPRNGYTALRTTNTAATIVNTMQRKATLQDFEALYQTYMDKETNPFMLWDLMDQDSFLPIAREMVAAGDLYVYEVDGRIAACYRLTRKQHRLRHIAYLGSFAVHPSFKGKAVGSQAMEALLQDLRSEGLKRLELLVVSDNHKAIAFYKKLGFEVEGLFKNFLKRANSEDYVDEFAMALLLN